MINASASDGTAHVSDSYSEFNAARAALELCSTPLHPGKHRHNCPGAGYYDNVQTLLRQQFHR
jgi:hypothetical protein